MEVKAYRLFAMKNTDANADEAMRMKFQRITPKYILVYDEDVPKNALEITDETVSALSKDDYQWLSNCNMAILKEFEQEHKSAIKKCQEDFMSEFEKELQIEKEKLNDGEQTVTTTE